MFDFFCLFFEVQDINIFSQKKTTCPYYIGSTIESCRQQTAAFSRKNLAFAQKIVGTTHLSSNILPK